MLDGWQQSYFFLSPSPLPLHLRLACPSLEDDRDAVVFTALALGRRFRSLKIWFVLRLFGQKKLQGIRKVGLFPMIKNCS